MAKPWFPLYWSDLRGDTQDLSQGEFGAYVLLIGHYYQTGKPLPTNVTALYRICMAFEDTEKQNVHTILRFFIKTDEGYRHKRIDAELEKAKEISDKRRAAVGKRWNTNVHTTTATTTYKEKEKSKPKEKKKFVQPTVAELRAHCDEKGYSVDVTAFHAFYTSNGWKVGKNPMKNWRAALVTWKTRQAQQQAAKPIPPQDKINGLRRPRDNDSAAWFALCERFDVPTYGKTNDELWVKIQAAYNRQQHEGSR